MTHPCNSEHELEIGLATADMLSPCETLIYRSTTPLIVPLGIKKLNEKKYAIKGQHFAFSVPLFATTN